MASRILCVGIATHDRVWRVERIPLPGEKIRSTSYLEVGGGQAANAAVTAARLGGEVQLWSVVGDDVAAATILDQLRAERVCVDGVARVADTRSVTAAVLVDGAGERSIIADFDPRLHAAAPSLPLDKIAGVGAVLADVKWAAGATQALTEARRRGIATIIDVEPAPPGHLEALCRLADHAIFGQPGLAAYTGTSDPAEGLAIAFSRLGGTVGVTLGARGVVIRTAAQTFEVPAPSVAVVDTTGAGDAFHGAYALAIADGQDAASAARFATHVAAMKCTKAGGRAGLPTRAEVAKFMECER